MSDDEFSALAVALAFTCDCLGCIMEAHQSGALSGEEYQAIFDLQEEMASQRATCPQCGETAYISMYEPDVMHCPSCGLYSHRVGVGDPWEPLRQGAVMERGRS